MYNYKKVVLDNGIRLYVHSDKTMKKTVVSYTLEYGHQGQYYKFNYDGKDYEVLPGCAHFLEHTLLERSRYGDLYIYFKSLKYQSNAYTSLNKTKFFFSGTKCIKSSIRKMINAIEKPVFNEEDIKFVSRAVIEETKRGLDNSYFQAFLLSIRNVFNSFEFINSDLSTIGTKETTEKLDYNMLKLCYDAFYSDDRKIISITGPIDEDDMIKYIKDIYSKIPKHENKTKVYIPDDLRTVRKKEDVLVKDNVEDDMISIYYNEYIEGYSIYEIYTYLGFLFLSKFSTKSEFYDRLKKEDILLSYEGYDMDHAYTDSNFYFGSSYIVRDKDKFLKEYYKEIENNNFTERDFELFKKSKLSDEVYKSQDKYYFYTYFPDMIVDYNQEIDFVTEIKKLSFDRFIEFYNQIDFNNKIITLLTKEG